MKQIIITLPNNRIQPGRLMALNGGVVEFTAECLGKADNGAAAQAGNPDRDPTKPFGDTPLGDYQPAGIVHLPPPAGHMGLLIIPLIGISLEALEAMQNGRKGLAIHGGRGDDKLIPTDGCVRLLDKDMAELSAFLGQETASISIESGEPGNES